MALRENFDAGTDDDWKSKNKYNSSAIDQPITALENRFGTKMADTLLELGDSNGRDLCLQGRILGGMTQNDRNQILAFLDAVEDNNGKPLESLLPLLTDEQREKYGASYQAYLKRINA